jgi:hypothetical protein
MVAPADRDGVLDHFRQVLLRIPDLSLKIIRWAPVSDAVLIEWEAQGSFNGKRLRWQGVDRVCLRNGRTYEGQVYWDTRRLADQIAETAAHGNIDAVA